MAVIEFEERVTQGVFAVVLEPHAPGSALLASAAGAEDLVDDNVPSDEELIAAFDAKTRPLDPDQIVH